MEKMTMRGLDSLSNTRCFPAMKAKKDTTGGMDGMDGTTGTALFKSCHTITMSWTSI